MMMMMICQYKVIGCTLVVYFRPVSGRLSRGATASVAFLTILFVLKKPDLYPKSKQSRNRATGRSLCAHQITKNAKCIHIIELC